LNVTDFLRTNNLVGTTNIDHYSETFRRSIESLVATLAFVYRFGRNKIAPSRRTTGGAEDEKKRANG
jgi:ferric enterobactin receptor